MERNDTTPNDYSAFNALDQKKKSQAYRVHPQSEVKGSGNEMAIVITIPISEVQKARPGTGPRKSLGFALGPDQAVWG